MGMIMNRDRVERLIDYLQDAIHDIEMIEKLEESLEIKNSLEDNMIRTELKIQYNKKLEELAKYFIQD
jgi:hypothetical protein